MEQAALTNQVTCSVEDGMAPLRATPLYFVLISFFFCAAAYTESQLEWIGFRHSQSKKWLSAKATSLNRRGPGKFMCYESP